MYVVGMNMGMGLQGQTEQGPSLKKVDSYNI